MRPTITNRNRLMSRRLSPIASCITALALLLTAACSSLPPGVPSRYEPSEIPGALIEIDQELEASQHNVALARARIASETKGLSPEQRRDVQRRLERAALSRIEELASGEGDAGALEEIFELELPRQLSVSAGMRSAEILFREGERMESYRMIRRVDLKYPQHQERPQAGALLFAIGMDFEQDESSYFLFFDYRDHAPEVFEYLVLNYPSESRCDQAYWILANMYEEDERWELAIERHEDLLLWYSGSPYVPQSRARIPGLRLSSLASPEYDRGQLTIALAELDRWLSDFQSLTETEPALTNIVHRDRLDTLQRLADNDIAVSHFYHRVDNGKGALYHARRAGEEARGGGSLDQIDEAQRWLARVRDDFPDAEELSPPKVEIPLPTKPTEDTTSAGSAGLNGSEGS
ncbi:MAG: tetratricopeptide (TPR) repeat protein [Planctomycetota bacterium]